MRSRALLFIFCVMVGCTPLHSFDLEARQRALQLIDQGVGYLRSGDLDRAEASFKVSLNLVPNSAALDGLGCVALLSGHLDRAEQYFIKAYQSDPNYTYSLGNLALLYELVGDRETALKLYQRALTENPRAFQFQNNYAAFLHDYLSVGDRRQSVRAELLKAEALVRHPIIQVNIDKVK
jgi:Tfp pilus assembly protein PilF